MWPSGLALGLTLTLKFKVKCESCFISAKDGPIDTKRKGDTHIYCTELWASNVTIGFDLDHDFDARFLGSHMEFAVC